jgi:hypothetical protein
MTYRRRKLKDSSFFGIWEVNCWSGGIGVRNQGCRNRSFENVMVRTLDAVKELTHIWSSAAGSALSLLRLPHPWYHIELMVGLSKPNTEY